jgi:hypothetical protein
VKNQAFSIYCWIEHQTTNLGVGSSNLPERAISPRFCHSGNPVATPFVSPIVFPRACWRGDFPATRPGQTHKPTPGIYPVANPGKWRQVQLRGKPLICCREVGKGTAPEGPLLALWESLGGGNRWGGGHGPPGVVGYSCR